MDSILDYGDKLYQNTGMSRYLLIDDIPEVYQSYKLNIVSACAGSVFGRGLTEAPYTSVLESIDKIQMYSFLTMKSSTVAILKVDNLFYVFDSHSRRSDGMLTLTLPTDTQTQIQKLILKDLVK